MKRTFVIAATLALCACQALQSTTATRGKGSTIATTMPMGTFDNHEQVWRAREDSKALPPPHLVVTVEPTSEAGLSLWRVRLDANPPLSAIWAMRRTVGADGAVAWTPYRPLVATPAAAFDAKEWAALDACTLRATSGGYASDVVACTALAPGIGNDAALMPLSFESDGEWLRVRLYADQARGADGREDMRLVQTFGGWAAINGAGPKGNADGGDWHMDRSVAIGSEGGRYALKYRDGNASGYALSLERLTYRDGNIPVLKLSVVDDGGRTIAYAWANPEATRIGINLGWVQVGLDRKDGAAQK
jgi:hypothetical protein